MSEQRTKHPKITVVGGGTGLPILLAGLKEANWDITAIVTVSDDGGSSGTIRSAVNTIPPGDIRNCIVALSDVHAIYKDVFQYRFAPEDQEFSGHAIGNLIIAALTEMRGDIYSALKLLSLTMDVKGRVLPASEDPLVLQAHYADGSTVDGETTIVKEKRPIEYVTVHQVGDPSGSKPVHAGRGVIKAIEEADLIILGPGSLYTSILPNLAIPEIRDAIVRSCGEVVYICNIMTQLGETEHFSDADHIRVINQHLGDGFVDVALLNNTKVPQSYIDTNEIQDYLIQVSHDPEGLREQQARIFECDLLNLKESGVYHDRLKLVEAIRQIYQLGK
ncbi:MAG: uridine diphosphate-N-acetylglucosamine-binding protein YvcK [Aerococcus sp.]|nr:uridine diphosphate-N-acetylglucosamine-binding protein YvcK [Aerococcus sp.]